LNPLVGGFDSAAHLAVIVSPSRYVAADSSTATVGLAEMSHNLVG